MTIKLFLLNFLGEGVKMCDNMTISDNILKIVENDPFLRLQMRAKEMFNQNCLEQSQKHVCNGAYDHYNYMETRL